MFGSHRLQPATGREPRSDSCPEVKESRQYHQQLDSPSSALFEVGTESFLLRPSALRVGRFVQWFTAGYAECIARERDTVSAMGHHSSRINGLHCTKCLNFSGLERQIPSTGSLESNITPRRIDHI